MQKKRKDVWFRMYVENTENLAKSLKKLAVTDCPSCGEESDENRLLSGPEKVYPKEET